METFSFRATRFSWWQFLTLTNWPGSRPHITVPACNDCLPILRRQRMMRMGMSAIVMITVTLAVVLALVKLGWLSGALRPFRYWIAVGVIIIVLLPYVAWELFHPPHIDATAYGDRIEYEFASVYNASKFADLNGGVVE